MVWNMRVKPTKEGTERMRQIPARFRRPMGRQVPPGEYVVILRVREKEFRQKARIL
ncbi:MAG: hypothetical protein ACE5L7_05715 [Candidatus Aminicenantales bacterium]